MTDGGIFIFGAGYSGRAFAAQRPDKAPRIAGTTRAAERIGALEAAGIEGFLFDGTLSDEVKDRLATARALVVSAAPGEDGDPVLNAARTVITGAMPRLEWIGYLSTVGVYGDWQGAWIDETAPCRPSSARSRQRLAAEQDWQALGEETGLPVAILRLSGIYGPGRNAFVNLAEGTARRLVKKDQVFNRIHVDDIAGALWHLLDSKAGGVFNVTDNEPAPPQDVVAYAAGLMGVEPPPEMPFETAELTPMARSFYGENKRVSNGLIKASGYVFRYPNYRAALEALWQGSNWHGEKRRDARRPIRAS